MCASPRKDNCNFESGADSGSQREAYILRLYVAGTTPQSTRAIRNARKFCEEYTEVHFDLRVIDIYQNPTLAIEDQIIAVPTLIKRLPPPLRKLVGDLSDCERIIKNLDLISLDASNSL